MTFSISDANFYQKKISKPNRNDNNNKFRVLSAYTRSNGGFIVEILSVIATLSLLVTTLLGLGKKSYGTTRLDLGNERRRLIDDYNRR